jgi:hypothetical protein
VSGIPRHPALRPGVGAHDGREPMLDFPTAFDLPTVERLETTAQQSTKQNGIDRKLAFAILTKFAAELRQAVAEDLEVLLTCAESLGEATKWHEGQAEASGILAAELTRLGLAQSGEAGELAVYDAE